MTDPQTIAHQFLDALVANDAAKLEAVLTDDAGLLMARCDSGIVQRPRHRAVQTLLEESARWSDAVVHLHSLIADGERVAVEFRIQATENARYVEHNRSAFLTLKDARVEFVNLYCPAPLPSARRTGWIAPAGMSDDEINRLFETFQFTFDAYEWFPPNASGALSMAHLRFGSGDAHPGSNGVGGTRWSEAEADARIEELLKYHHARNIGFAWFVGDYDTPADLSARLEQHGFALAGDQAMMGRVDLEHLDIPINPQIEIELLDGSDDDALEATLQIIARGFNMTEHQVNERRPGFMERLKDAKRREDDIEYLARLDGKPVAEAHLVLRAGIAYLAGAVTLPEYRGKKIYSTLLRRRLEDARARGYHVAAIHAEPMSRRVVSRYGFKEYARVRVYGWMPVMDMQVIKSLVPDE
ncbi:MAG: GNAT family N-acetyltransferase [Chloroflexi bacterium]|nr:GNAT family N-acetyltransferase [Chloroflexota bacterium]